MRSYKLRFVKLLVMTCIVMMGLLMAAPVPAKAACRHHWTVYADNRTCTKGGQITYKCIYCGKYDMRYGAAKGHSYLWVTKRAPTCTSAGVQVHRCIRCRGIDKQRTTAKTAHHYQYTGKTVRSAGQTRKIYKCTGCGSTKYQ